jgi:hypothetical protein
MAWLMTLDWVNASSPSWPISAPKPDCLAPLRTNAPDGNISIGMSQFMLDLAKARLADAQRALQDPNAHRLEVEDAMLVTLKIYYISGAVPISVSD